jgi:hypothetical protein
VNVAGLRVSESLLKRSAIYTLGSLMGMSVAVAAGGDCEIDNPVQSHPAKARGLAIQKRIPLSRTKKIEWSQQPGQIGDLLCPSQMVR